MDNLEEGDRQGAIRNLEAYIAQLGGSTSRGFPRRLPLATQALIDCANEIIDAIDFVDKTQKPRGAARPGAMALETAAVPDRFALDAAYPNPFNPTTTVPFAVPERGDVRLAVFDLLGREVALLADGAYDAGHHTARFEADGLPSGTYLVRLTTPAGVFTQKLLLMK